MSRAFIQLKPAGDIIGNHRLVGIKHTTGKGGRAGRPEPVKAQTLGASRKPLWEREPAEAPCPGGGRSSRGSEQPEAALDAGNGSKRSKEPEAAPDTGDSDKRSEEPEEDPDAGSIDRGAVGMDATLHAIASGTVEGTREAEEMHPLGGVRQGHREGL